MNQQSPISPNQVRAFAAEFEHGRKHRFSTATTPAREAPFVETEQLDDSAAVSVRQLRTIVGELFRALDDSLREDRVGAEQRLQRAAGLLASVEAAEAADAPAPTAIRVGGLAPWQIQRVTSHIEANLDTTIRNAELAVIARLSPFYFNVAFRKSMGTSPHDYIIRRRIQRAQGLMLSTEVSLSEIALTCGLADQAHFTRLFRKFVGDSPAAWRRARANPPREETGERRELRPRQFTPRPQRQLSRHYHGA